MIASLEELSEQMRKRLPRYLEDLDTLVRIDSHTSDRDGVNRVVDWLESRFRAMGATVERIVNPQHGDDLLARLTGDGGANILLLGHSDTVYPPGTIDKRPMEVDGDVIRGPGTCDMKSGLISGIYALELLLERGWRGFGIITCLVVSDEEGADRHSIQLIETEGARQDAVFTLEAARENGDLVSARKAVRWFEVTARGRAAHAGVEPEKGESAVIALSAFVLDAAGLTELSAGRSVNPGTICGGSAANIVAETARVRFDLRAWTNAELATLEQGLGDLVEQHSNSSVRFKMCEVEGSYSPAMERTEGVIQLERRAQEIANQLGFTVRGAATGGASDISFAMLSGTPGLDGLGPVGGLDHSPDEYIEMSSIVPRIALLAGLIMQTGEGSSE